MGNSSTELKGPDLANGIDLSNLRDGESLLGHSGGEAVLVARRGQEFFAISANCTHYGGPLAEGAIGGETVRCPWHHACFSLRTGTALAAPALNPVACWRTEIREGQLFVPGKKPDPASIRRVIIVGAGAAGGACAEMLRREGFGGEVLLLGADPYPPYDRPNLSKDYLAGQAPEEWIPLRPPSYYNENRITLRLGTRVELLDLPARQVVLAGSGEKLAFDALALCTGAEAARLSLPGAELSHVRVLRSLEDCMAIIAQAKKATRAVVIGGSFIGMEAAAALRTRGLEVTVVTREACPFERVLGGELGRHLLKLHEQNGVAFRLGQLPASIDAKAVTLEDGSRIEAELVLAGVGAKPVVGLAQAAGLKSDPGVSVNEYLMTAEPGIYAAGDIALYPDPLSGERIRVEHWVVAQRQGQAVARNILGRNERYQAVPYFWSSQFGLSLSYVGHGVGSERTRVSGSLESGSATVSYWRAGRVSAIATVGRDAVSLEAELAFERRDFEALERIAG